MASQPSASILFDALSAELLAVDLADLSAVSDIAVKLAAAADSLAVGSAESQAALLTVRALRAFAQRRINPRDETGTALAETISGLSAVLREDTDANRRALSAGIASLRKLLGNVAVVVDDAALLEAPTVEADNATEEAPADRSQEPAEGAESQTTDMDEDLLRDFAAEALDHVATAESAVLELESDKAGGAEQVNTILRAFHTIKGAAAFLGLDDIQKLSHTSEHLLSRARNGEIRISGAHADVVLRSCDLLRKLIEAARDGRTGLDRGTYERVLQVLRTPQPTAADAAADVPAADGGDAAARRPERHGESDATARISTRRLDDLVDMVGELVIAHSMVAQSMDGSSVREGELFDRISQAGKIVRQLQSTAMSLRMVPLRGMFARMARVVRDLSRRSGKNVRFVGSGEETEIDRNMVEVLTDPLVHMIRNAVDHGIEPAEQRAAAGKNATGTISLRAYHSAGNVVIELQDDGGGLDREAILAKGIADGLVVAGQELADADIDALIFHPGFSTSARVTDVSGRGVGMDVVKRNVTRLRGQIQVETRRGAGTLFRLRLPLTMAITDAMLIRVGAERYLLPTISIERCFRPDAAALSTVVGRGEVVAHSGKLLPLVRLHALFDVPDAQTEASRALVVVISGAGKQCGLLVDELLGHQQAVIKSLGRALQSVRGAAGGTILGDGRVGLILDADVIVQLAFERSRQDESVETTA